MKTAVMTDTNSGITKRVADKFGIHLIHMPIVIDGKVFYEGEKVKTDFTKLIFVRVNNETDEMEVETDEKIIGEVVRNSLDKINA